VKKPLGLFKDGENNIWICDFGNSRLLAVDSSSYAAEEIRLKEILDEAFESIHPAFGCFRNNQFYLLLLNDLGQQRRLVFFDRYNIRNSLNFLPTDPFEVLNVFEFLNNKLYACDYAQCDLFIYDEAKRNFNKIGCHRIPYPFRCFTPLPDGLFLSAGKYILKMRSDKEIVFTANLTKVLGTDRVRPFGLTFFNKGDTSILFISDDSLGCIHRFITQY